MGTRKENRGCPNEFPAWDTETIPPGTPISAIFFFSAPMGNQNAIRKVKTEIDTSQTQSGMFPYPFAFVLRRFLIELFEDNSPADNMLVVTQSALVFGHGDRASKMAPLSYMWPRIRFRPTKGIAMSSLGKWREHARASMPKLHTKDMDNAVTRIWPNEFFRVRINFRKAIVLSSEFSIRVYMEGRHVEKEVLQKELAAQRI